MMLSRPYRSMPHTDDPSDGVTVASPMTWTATVARQGTKIRRIERLPQTSPRRPVMEQSQSPFTAKANSVSIKQAC